MAGRSARSEPCSSRSSGLPVAAGACSARPHDVVAGRDLLRERIDGLPRLRAIVGDRAYRGLAKLASRKHIALDIKAPAAGRSGFTPLWPPLQGRAHDRSARPLAPALALLRGHHGQRPCLARGRLGRLPRLARGRLNGAPDGRRGLYPAGRTRWPVIPAFQGPSAAPPPFGPTATGPPKLVPLAVRAAHPDGPNSATGP